MFPLERAEHRLIVACAMPHGYKAISNELFDDDAMDWSSVLELASRHRIAPLLHHFLSVNPRVAVPEEVSKLLKSHANEQTISNLFQTQELIKILGLLQGAGLDAMPFKGPVLGQYLYGNLGLRPFGDLDILIRRNQYSDVKSVLAAHGYRPYRNLKPEEERVFLDTQMGFEFVRNDGQCVIEIHWSFLNSVHAFKLPVQDVWLRSRYMEISGKQVRVFSPEDLLVYLCAHGSKSLWSRLRWICDIAEFVQKHQDRHFWRAVQKIARESSSARMLKTGLRLAHSLLDAPLRPEVLRSVNADMKTAVLTGQVIKSLFSPAGSTDKNVNPVSFHLQMHERFRDRIPYYKHLFQIWSAPSTKDKDFVSLPRYLEFLYILIKPLRMMVSRGPIKTSTENTR